MALQFPGYVQTSYPIYTQPLQAGMLLWGNSDLPATIGTYVSATQNIAFGIGVVGDFATGDRNLKLPSSSGDKLLGIALLNSAQESPVFDQTGTGINPSYYTPAYPIAVLSQNNGAAVNIDGNVAPGSAVYCRFAGRKQVQTLTGSGNWITGNTIAGSVVYTNAVTGVVTTTAISVPFNTSDSQTSTDLATAIAAAVGVFSAAVSATDVVTVTTAVNGSTIVLQGFVVTGGASQVTIAIAQTVAGVPDANIGFFRADSDSSTAFAVSGARWDGTQAASQSAPALGRLIVNIPVGSGF